MRRRTARATHGHAGRMLDTTKTPHPPSNPLTLIANSPVLMPLRRVRWQPRRTRKEGNGQQWGHSRLHATDVGAQRS
eukprot:4888934-Prymnesium_polylepis.1